MPRRVRRCLIVSALAAVVLPASCGAKIWSYGYTGGVQTWVVPEGVHRANFDVFGAAGGEPFIDGFHPGKGGRAQSELAVTPGATIYIYVGGRGGYPGAGWNGGGEGRRFGGGGATDIRIGGQGLHDRRLVAGGGGGVGDHGGSGRGDGGGLAGASGRGNFGGAGGTQTAAGEGTYPVWSGFFGRGGPGANPGPNVTGGGGGGWYGGAGGPGGGGGGSGYGPAGTFFQTGDSEGNGSAKIVVPDLPPTGHYSGGSSRGTVSFILSHDHRHILDFRIRDHTFLDVAPWEFGGANFGRFSVFTGGDVRMHIFGYWSSEQLGLVHGGYGFSYAGQRVVEQWTAAPG